MAVVMVVLAACGGAGAGPAQDPESKSVEQPGDAQALSMRYRFVERYSAQEDAARPEVLTQYRVGSRDTVTAVREKPQGAPDRAEKSVQVIYTERVAKVSNQGMVAEVVRRYDRVNFRTTLPIPPSKTKRLEGLTVLYRLQNRAAPLVVSLNQPARTLRQDEYEQISQQTFLPALTYLLPRQAVRIGDTWAVPRRVVWALVGDEPADEDYDVTAELVEVRKNQPGTSMTAVIGVKGRFTVPAGPAAINTQVDFTFEPSPFMQPSSGRPGEGVLKDQPPGTATPSGRPVAGVVDAKGHISKVRMAQELTIPLPEDEGRLKQTVTRKLLLERRTPNPAGGAPEDAPLSPPPDPLNLTPENSWLSYEDPEGRFHFLHPQELRVAKVYPDGGVDLLDRRASGPDVIQISLVPKTQDPSQDRLAGDPIQQKKLLEEEWKKQGEKVLPGPSGWLPDAEWSPLGRKVYRIEAALRPADDTGPVPQGGRIYFDQYVVQFRRNETLKVVAMTTQDPHLNFRNQAEAIIKSFDFGTSDGSAPAAPAPASAPGPAPPPPQ
jgi:hypothetical protein